MAEENNGMSQEMLAALLNSGPDGTAGPPYNPKTQGEGASKAVLTYLEQRDDFQSGDIVRQRESLAMNRHTTPPHAWAFVKYLEKEERIVIKVPQYFEIDCVLAQLDSEGDAVLMVADSHRFEAYPKDELEKYGAEAAKAIN